jgi:hypothetical protein
MDPATAFFCARLLELLPNLSAACISVSVADQRDTLARRSCDARSALVSSCCFPHHER